MPTADVIDDGADLLFVQLNSKAVDNLHIRDSKLEHYPESQHTSLLFHTLLPFKYHC